MEQEQKTPRDRAPELVTLLMPAWRPNTAQVLWVIRIAIVLVVVLGILTSIGLPFEITLWEWLKLLIVPAVIAIGGLWFNQQQRKRELDLAERHTQDDALQAYIDQLGQLMLDKDEPLRQSEEGSEVRILAQVRTLTMLSRLDGSRKRTILQFLYGSDLITKDNPILTLQGADLSQANLRGLDLSRAYLRETDLRKADLRYTHLEQADLQHAYLQQADLHEAYLMGADLTDASITALTRLPTLANLLSGTATDLETGQIEYLESATMPNGRKLEELLKDGEGHGEHGENSGPSQRLLERTSQKGENEKSTRNRHNEQRV